MGRVLVYAVGTFIVLHILFYAVIPAVRSVMRFFL